MMKSNRNRITVITAAAISLCAAAYSQQSSNLEQRVLDLERRVAKLEARAGVSALPEAAQQTRSPQAAQPERAYATSMPLVLQLVNKKTVKSNEAGRPDELQFTVQFKNTGVRDITDIEGDLVVKNISAKPLLDFGISASKYIAAGDSILWACAVDYDPKEDGHRVVSQSDKSYLVIELKPESISYSDGTSDVYRTPR